MDVRPEGQARDGVDRRRGASPAIEPRLVAARSRGADRRPPVDDLASRDRSAMRRAIDALRADRRHARAAWTSGVRAVSRRRSSEPYGLSPNPTVALQQLEQAEAMLRTARDLVEHRTAGLARGAGGVTLMPPANVGAHRPRAGICGRLSSRMGVERRPMSALTGRAAPRNMRPIVITMGVERRRCRRSPAARRAICGRLSSRMGPDLRAGGRTGRETVVTVGTTCDRVGVTLAAARLDVIGGRPGPPRRREGSP